MSSSWQDAVQCDSADAVAMQFRRHSRAINDALPNGHTPLTMALQLRNQDVVMRLLQLGASASQPHVITRVNPWNKALTQELPVYPLQIACDLDWAWAVHNLLKCQARPSDCRGGIKGLLMKAVEWDDITLCKKLFTLSRREDQYITPSFKGLLTVAVQKGSVGMVELLLKRKQDVNAAEGGMVPLLAAAQAEDIGLCELLVRHGADLGLTAKSSLRPNALAMAVQGALLPAVNTLIALGARLDCRLSLANCEYSKGVLCSGSTVLHLAVAKRHHGLVQVLMMAGAPLDAKDNEGNTPLHVACKDPNADIEVVEYLLATAHYYAPQQPDHHDNQCIIRSADSLFYSRIATVNAHNLAGLSALALSCERGRVDLVALLRASGADLESRDSDQQTALHHAVRGGHEALAEFLLDAGLCVNARSHAHLTPLHVSVANRRLSMAQLLLDRGADIAMTTRSNETVLYLAVQNDDEDMVELLLESGCDVDAVTVSGETALMLACRRNQSEICERLIAAGALLDLQSFRQRETGLSMAAYFGCTRSAAVMIAQGADLDKCDKGKTTPVYWCIYNTREALLRLLIIAGVRLNLSQFSAYPQHLTIMRNTELVSWVTYILSSPCPLLHLARSRVRTSLVERAKGRGIAQSVDKLPLPRKLRDFVMLRGEIKSEEELEGEEDEDEEDDEDVDEETTARENGLSYQ